MPTATPGFEWCRPSRGDIKYTECLVRDLKHGQSFKFKLDGLSYYYKGDNVHRCTDIPLDHSFTKEQLNTIVYTY